MVVIDVTAVEKPQPLGVAHGIACIPVSDEAPAGWGRPVTEGNAPLGTIGGTRPQDVFLSKRNDTFYPNPHVRRRTDVLAGSLEWVSTDRLQRLVFAGPSGRYFGAGGYGSTILVLDYKFFGPTKAITAPGPVAGAAIYRADGHPYLLVAVAGSASQLDPLAPPGNTIDFYKLDLLDRAAGWSAAMTPTEIDGTADKQLMTVMLFHPDGTKCIGVRRDGSVLEVAFSGTSPTIASETLLYEPDDLVVTRTYSSGVASVTLGAPESFAVCADYKDGSPVWLISERSFSFDSVRSGSTSITADSSYTHRWKLLDNVGTVLYDTGDVVGSMSYTEDNDIGFDGSVIGSGSSTNFRAYVIGTGDVSGGTPSNVSFADLWVYYLGGVMLVPGSFDPDTSFFIGFQIFMPCPAVLSLDWADLRTWSMLVEQRQQAVDESLEGRNVTGTAVLFFDATMAFTSTRVLILNGAVDRTVSTFSEDDTAAGSDGGHLVGNPLGGGDSFVLTYPPRNYLAAPATGGWSCTAHQGVQGSDAFLSMSKAPREPAQRASGTFTLIQDFYFTPPGDPGWFNYLFIDGEERDAPALFGTGGKTNPRFTNIGSF